jgi:hypothetical protein
MTERETDAFWDSFCWALLSGREPRIVNGLSDFERQSNLFKSGKRLEVRRVLKKRAAGGVTYWMRMFGSRRGAPKKHDPVLFRLLGEWKRRKRLSWSQLAKLVNPAMLREKPTAYNVQQAVRRAEKQSKPSKSPLI